MGASLETDGIERSSIFSKRNVSRGELPEAQQHRAGDDATREELPRPGPDPRSSVVSCDAGSRKGEAFESTSAATGHRSTGGCGFFGTSYNDDPETKATKLNAELANGRLAMLGIAGAMFAEGQTGETLAQQFENLSFSIV